VKVGAADSTGGHINGLTGASRPNEDNGGASRPNGNNGSAAATTAEASTNVTSDSAPRVQLLRTSKFFAKKSITQLAAVPEYSILVSLCDGMVSVYDLDPAVMR